MAFTSGSYYTALSSTFAPVLASGSAYTYNPDSSYRQMANALSSGSTGTTTDDNAPTGYIGEYISASIVRSSPVTTAPSVPITLTSINLTARRLGY